MLISRVQLKNIRGFKDLDLDLSNQEGKPRLRTAIIGKNGTCKTTLLRCIALGLCDSPQANALLHEYVGAFVSEGEKTGQIIIELSPLRGRKGKINITTKIKEKKGRDFVENKRTYEKIPQPLLVCGYGAGRSTEGPESGRPYQIVDSVYTLFNYDQTLISTELTLRRLRDYLKTKGYDNTLWGIKRALGLDRKTKILVKKGGGVFISGPNIGKDIPLDGWADGYRRTFNWILDLYAWAMRANKVTDLGGINGIVLIDEIEQHIHPSMQMELLDKLLDILPDLQIIATTHSPLVALGVEPEELVVLKRKGKHVEDVGNLPNFKGFSAEDILLDERLFETGVYRPEIQEKLGDYEKLAQVPKKKRTTGQKNKLKGLAKDLGSQEMPEKKKSDLSRDLDKLINKYNL